MKPSDNENKEKEITSQEELSNAIYEFGLLALICYRSDAPTKEYLEVLEVAALELENALLENNIWLNEFLARMNIEVIK